MDDIGHDVPSSHWLMIDDQGQSIETAGPVTRCGEALNLACVHMMMNGTGLMMMMMPCMVMLSRGHAASLQGLPMVISKVDSR
jgi:hypothetical protein